MLLIIICCLLCNRLQPNLLDQCHYFLATGKLTVGRRPGNLTLMNKSQTLPRNMSRALTNVNSTAPKKPATPPAIRRQFSNPNGSPRRTNNSNISGRATPPRSRTPHGPPQTVVPSSQSAATTISVKGVEQKMVQTIMDEIIEGGQRVEFSDVAGNEAAKQALKEMVIFLLFGQNCLLACERHREDCCSLVRQEMARLFLHEQSQRNAQQHSSVFPRPRSPASTLAMARNLCVLCSRLLVSCNPPSSS